MHVLKLKRVHGILHDEDDDPRCDFCKNVPQVDAEDCYELYQMVGWAGVTDEDGSYNTPWVCIKCGGGYEEDVLDRNVER